MRWNLEKIKEFLEQNNITLISSDDECYAQIDNGVRAGKVKLRIICTECKKEECIKDIDHIANRGQTTCKKCLSTIYSDNMRNKNLKWWRDKEYSEHIKEICRSRKGILNGRFNPHITDEEREIQRNTQQNYEWRNNVYVRDNYRCVLCGDDKGHNLIAHHLDGWDRNRDKRYDVSNGVTLCEACHKNFHHIYGYGDNSKEQFCEYKRKFKTLNNNDVNRDAGKRSNDKSSIIGVSFNKNTKKWSSRISVHGKDMHLFTSRDMKNCIIARLLAEKQYLGDASPQKHLFDKYEINRWESLNDFKSCIYNVRGVSKRNDKWIVKISRKYEKDIYIGMYENYNEAVVARLNKEYEIFGDDAPQYYLFEKYNIRME